MAIPNSSSSNRDAVEVEDEESEDKSQPLIPGLPEEIAELCLLYLPYPYQALVRSVSSSWNRAITDPGFILSRKSLSLSLPYLFVFAFHKSTARIQWQALDPRSGRWFVLPPMPCPKAVCPPGFACASVPRQGKLFVLGGMRSDTETPMQTTFVYRSSTNQWSEASPMKTARSFFAAGNINGKIMAVGGSGANNEAITAVECYNPDSDTWTEVAKLRTGLARYDSAVVGSSMYVTEGWTWPFMFSPRATVYDAKMDRWQLMRDGLKEGWTGISFVLDDTLFVISEHGDCPMKWYIPDVDTWQYVGGDRFPCDTVRRPFAVSGLEGRIYVVASDLNVAVGRIYPNQNENDAFCVEWKVMGAPKAFKHLAPSSCQVLFA
ncbi:hypothetical protein ACOSP7_007926 [Xanthoceras sorbifolium]|uniref:F-box domain-containing protein n=1 Tax=Xanthoceras sorbifolium TaxID=99658 RepID=A0ABQ8IBD3_9ROSI|nr:hypothetical protein JRO89_XS03G0233000 [Xanthoceras sorbifolium]